MPLEGLIAFDTGRAAKTLGTHAKVLGEQIRTHRPHVAAALERDMRELEHGPARLEAATRAFSLGAGGIVVRVQSEIARARNAGAYITPRDHTTSTGRARALKFEQGGQTIFRQHVRIRGNRYFDHAYARASQVIERVARSDFRSL